MVDGNYGGRSDELQPGGASYEAGHTPHGVAYEEFTAATEEELVPQRISEGTVAFMFESSRTLTLTDWVMNRSGNKHEHERASFPPRDGAVKALTCWRLTAKMWDPLRAQFIDRLDEVNRDRRQAGLPEIEAKNATAEMKQQRTNGSHV